MKAAARHLFRIGLLLLVWEVCGDLRLIADGALPSPSAILLQWWQDREVYPPHIAATVWPAFIGFLLGNVIAIAAAVAFVLAPALERLMRGFNIAVFAIPPIAISPVLVITLMLSGVLFVFDHSVVTQANIIQDGLRNKIRGHAAQTYLNPERKWICGNTTHDLRIFYYKHFDQDQGVLGGVQVYDIDASFPRLDRHLLAERAHWEPTLNTWVFENGWVREFGTESDKYRPFPGSVATFKDIAEPPSWFRKEVKTYKQLTFPQLRDYIAELQRSGFNTIPLQVQYHKKFAVPLFVFVMALLSVPFAFMTGSRGAMTGVGVSLLIAAAYFGLNYLFEQLGGTGQLPPAVAAWAPDGIFALAGLYLMMQMRS